MEGPGDKGGGISSPQLPKANLPIRSDRNASGARRSCVRYEASVVGWCTTSPTRLWGETLSVLDPCFAPSQNSHSSPASSPGHWSWSMSSSGCRAGCPWSVGPVLARTQGRLYPVDLSMNSCRSGSLLSVGAFVDWCTFWGVDSKGLLGEDLRLRSLVLY